MLEAIGKNIVERREARDMNVHQLAQELGTESRVVARWEAGEGLPSAYYLAELSKLFGCSVDELMGFDATRVTRCGKCKYLLHEQVYPNRTALKCWQTGVTVKLNGYCDRAVEG